MHDQLSAHRLTRLQLTQLNQIYLATLSNWTVNSLESQLSAQVVYNLPMDMLANVPYVNAPECESLGFGHLIDGYRQYSGPANLVENPPRLLRDLLTHITFASRPASASSPPN